MVKKLLAAALCFVFTIGLFGCSEKTNASDKALSVGKQAISIVDEYLDGTATYEEAYEKLSELQEEMDYVDDMDRENEHRVDDFLISSDLIMLSHRLLMDYYDGTDETYNDIIEQRNDLAEEIGESKR